MLHLYPSSLLRSVGARGEGGSRFWPLYGACCCDFSIAPGGAAMGLQLWMGEGRDGTAHGSGSSWVKIRE